MITIDAQDKTLGRVAAAAAKAILGKHKTTFVKNAAMGEEVTVVNAGKVRISGNKTRAKEYIRYSGYPGGQKIESYQQLTDRRGKKEAIRRAVLRMLPKNKLQTPRIKMLKIEE
jgi:large subunit ribosomal protein L13